MPVEIERKFRVMKDKTPWDAATDWLDIVQGYICTEPRRTVRIRSVVLKNGWSRGYITIKGETTWYSRPEFEYSIPYDNATDMLNLMCDSKISKRRYIVMEGDDEWHVDVFDSDNKGLVTAEIELEHPEQYFYQPSWLGAEITDDPRYANSNLSIKPYSTW